VGRERYLQAQSHQKACMLIAELVWSVVGDPSAGYSLTPASVVLRLSGDQSETGRHSVVKLCPLKEIGSDGGAVQRDNAGTSPHLEWTESSVAHQVETSNAGSVKVAHLSVHDKRRNADGLCEERPLAVECEHASTHRKRRCALREPSQLRLLFGLRDTNKAGVNENGMLTAERVRD
jgi:hypothetical protein